MSKAIYKYPLDLNDLQDDSSIPTQMPTGANALYAAKQRGEIVLYAVVDPTAALVQRMVYVFGTEQPLDHLRGAQPMGVIHGDNDYIMFHVFIEPERV